MFRAGRDKNVWTVDQIGIDIARINLFDSVEYAVLHSTRAVAYTNNNNRYARIAFCKITPLKRTVCKYNFAII